MLDRTRSHPISRRRMAASLGCLAFPLPLQGLAQPVVQLRFGTVVPKNSLYHQQLLEMGEAWRAAQGAGARFTVFTDGSQGGEAKVARRMRIGQLQGALVSVVGLRDRTDDCRAAEPAATVSQLGGIGLRAREVAPGHGEALSGPRLRRDWLGRRRLGALLLQGAGFRA